MSSVGVAYVSYVRGVDVHTREYQDLRVLYMNDGSVQWLDDGDHIEAIRETP